MSQGHIEAPEHDREDGDEMKKGLLCISSDCPSNFDPRVGLDEEVSKGMRRDSRAERAILDGVTWCVASVNAAYCRCEESEEV